MDRPVTDRTDRTDAPVERAVRAVERAGTPDGRSRRGRPWLLVVLTVAVWIGVVVALVVGHLLTRQPPLTPVPIGG